MSLWRRIAERVGLGAALRRAERGGQAVVGTIERPGGGDQSKTEEQPHAKQITDAPEPALWGEDADRDDVPVPRDGERSLPDARGKVSGRTDR